MKRLALPLIALILVSCATMSQTPQGLVSRAVQAQGGADGLAGVKTIAVKGTTRQWEPEQSMTAGGDMRFANDATFDVLFDAATGAFRTDWVTQDGPAAAAHPSAAIEEDAAPRSPNSARASMPAGSPARPRTASSASSRPVSGANLKPCPEQADAYATRGSPGQQSTMKSSVGVIV